MALTGRGSGGGSAVGPPARLLLGSIHCHSTLSDGSGAPEEILARAASVGLDFVAITDHVPSVMDDRPAAVRAALGATRGGPGTATPVGPRPGETGLRPPLTRAGVVRLPGLEFSPDRNHYLVLGLDPVDVPDPQGLPGWPEPASYLDLVAGRPGAIGFVAHPDDQGNAFLGVKAYPWDDWGDRRPRGFTGFEVWNLSTDWSRRIKGYGDIVRAEAAGLYRAVPAPNPVTLARWDRLAQSGPVPGVAGTDAHAHMVHWHGLKLTILPYGPSLATLQTAVWVEREAADGPVEARIRGILEALGQGRSFMVNRAWGHPASFVFRAREAASGEARGPARDYALGETVPAGVPVRFEVSLPRAAWIRLLRNGEVVANTYGREMSFEPLDCSPEPLDGSSGPSGPPDPDAPALRPRQEAWRVEIWTNAAHWSRMGSGFFLWLLSNFIYRAL